MALLDDRATSRRPRGGCCSAARSRPRPAPAAHGPAVRSARRSRSPSRQHASPYWWTHPDDVRTPGGSQPSTRRSRGRDRRATSARQAEFGKSADRPDQRDRSSTSGRTATRATSASSRRPAFIGVGLVLFAIWGTMIYFLNKWGKDGVRRDDPATSRPHLREAEQALRARARSSTRITITAAATPVGDVARTELVVDDVPGDLRGQPVPHLLRVLPGAVPAAGRPAAVQGATCGRSSSSTWAR